MTSTPQHTGDHCEDQTLRGFTAGGSSTSKRHVTASVEYESMSSVLSRLSGPRTLPELPEERNTEFSSNTGAEVGNVSIGQVDALMVHSLVATERCTGPLLFRATARRVAFESSTNLG